MNPSTGVITTVAGNGTAGYSGDGGPATAAELTGPGGVAVDSAGDLFIADTDNDRIREVNLATGVITTVAGNGTAATAATTVRPPPPNCATPGCRGGRRRGPLHRRHRQRPDPRGRQRGDGGERQPATVDAGTVRSR